MELSRIKFKLVKEDELLKRKKFSEAQIFPQQE